MLELVAAGFLVYIAFEVPMYGLLWVGGGLGLGGLFTLLASQWMSQRTQEGARADGMLKAYRRTLRKTLEQSRSMEQVVSDPVVHVWTDTPDKAMVWGVALGLRDEIAAVLERSLEDRRKGVAGETWYPYWVARPSSGGSWATGHARSSGVRALFSSSPIPNVGAMLNTIGTIGRPPSSSGGGRGGGFSGGSSSGGGSASRGF
jgi:hypothetical protein